MTLASGQVETIILLQIIEVNLSRMAVTTTCH